MQKCVQIYVEEKWGRVAALKVVDSLAGSDVLGSVLGSGVVTELEATANASVDVSIAEEPWGKSLSKVVTSKVSGVTCRMS